MKLVKLVKLLKLVKLVIFPNEGVRTIKNAFTTQIHHNNRSKSHFTEGKQY